MSKNDSAEIRMVTHRKSGSKDFDYLSGNNYPETTFLCGLFETPLLNRKLALGATASYNHFLLRWVHHVPILNSEKSYVIQLQSRYRIGKKTFSGISFGYLNRISQHTVFSSDTTKYDYKQEVFHLRSGLAYFDKKTTFSMHLDWENQIFSSYSFSLKNQLFLNIFASRLIHIKSKSITFQPYMFWYSEDLFNSPQILSFLLPLKTGITCTRKPLFLNVDFGLLQFASLTAGCILFDNRFHVSLSYVFYDYYHHPQDLFRKEMLNITNINRYMY